MNKNTMRPTANVSVAMVASKPPRPPCWMDFLSPPSSSRIHNLSDSEFTDLNKLAKSSDSYSSDGQITNKTRKAKRVRARIHRTRSQFAIEETDLPEGGTLTVTLAETKPSDLGLRQPPVLDEKIFKENNNRKCRTWLESLEACEPFEDVSKSGDLYPETEAGGVAIEIPDDTSCYETVLRPHAPSVSGCDTDRRTKPLHRSMTVDTRQEEAAHTTDKKHNKSKHLAIFSDKHSNG